MTWEIHNGDVRAKLAKMPAGSIQTVCCSPPYWSLRSYSTDPQIWGGDPNCTHEWHTVTKKGISGGKNSTKVQIKGAENFQITPDTLSNMCVKCPAWHGELGSEPSPQMFIDNMVEVFRAVKRVLRDDGILWINIADSYAGSGKGPSGKDSAVQNTEKRQGFSGGDVYKGLPAKTMCLVPERLLIALLDDGWYIRSKIRLIKRSAMPESARDRPSNATEELYMLTKNAHYFYDMDAVRTDHTTDWIGRSERGVSTRNNLDRVDGGGLPTTGNPLGANIKNWWYWENEPDDSEFCTECDTYYTGIDKRRIQTRKFKGSETEPCVCDATDTHSARVCPECGLHHKWIAHYARFPTFLPERCILASTSLHGACKNCGAPWERITETSYKNDTTKSGRPAIGNDTKRIGHEDEVMGFKERTRKISNTLGWAKTCTCDCEDVVPCKVADIFSGSGTTALVADRLGRHGIGIELNVHYYRLSLQRIVKDAPMIAAVEKEEKKLTQASLFEEF